MSSATVETRRRADPAAAWVVAAMGAAGLLIRPYLVDRGSVSLAVLYAALLLVAVGTPIRASALRPPETAPLRSGNALLVGLAAVIAATYVVGRPIPAPPASLAGALGTSVLAAVAEEALFRRLLYGTMLRLGAMAAVVLSAAAFAAIHVPAYGTAALWVDFGAGLILGWQRWASGGWAAPAATHVAANLLGVLR